MALEREKDEILRQLESAPRWLRYSANKNEEYSTMPEPYRDLHCLTRSQIQKAINENRTRSHKDERPSIGERWHKSLSWIPLVPKFIERTVELLSDETLAQTIAVLTTENLVAEVTLGPTSAEQFRSTRFSRGLPSAVPELSARPKLVVLLEG